MLKIIAIPALKDNYIWLGIEEREAFVVDPGEADSVISFLENHQLNLTAILVTHKHMDHTGGITKLVERYPHISIFAHSRENVLHTTHPVQEGETIYVNHHQFKVLEIPGHTLGHVAYYEHPILFTGDTLFGAGCGRVFEGTAEQMLASLDKLNALPDDVLVYCGHEYTLANLDFAMQVEPDNDDILMRLKLTEKLRQNKLPSLPSPLVVEKRTNPFLRCRKKGIIESVQQHCEKILQNPVDVFYELREWKNQYTR